jgi:hypothetical protein
MRRMRKKIRMGITATIPIPPEVTSSPQTTTRATMKSMTKIIMIIIKAMMKIQKLQIN